MRFGSLILLVAGVISVSAACAEPPTAVPSSPPATSGGDIVVDGVSAKTVDTFVRQVVSVQGDRQLSRWNRPICVRILNLNKVVADYIGGRVAEVGRAAGVEVASAPCKANILIIATTDPDGAVKQIRDDYPSLFRFRDNGDRPVADYKDLLKPVPVRWIDATETLGQDGAEMQVSNGVPTNNVLTPSAIDTYTREDAALSIMVVDADELQGTSNAQLADYLAMVALAHPRFGADFQGSTILALFTGHDTNRSAPSGLTAIDLALLKSLYSTSNLRTAGQQRHAIKYQIRHSKQADAGKGQ